VRLLPLGSASDVLDDSDSDTELAQSDQSLQAAPAGHNDGALDPEGRDEKSDEVPSSEAAADVHCLTWNF